MGLFLSFGGTLGVLLVETGMSGNFLSGINGVKHPFEAQEGRWDFSRDASVEMGLNSP